MNKYATNVFSLRAHLVSIFPCHSESIEESSVAKNQTISPDKFFISSRLYKSFACKTLNRNAPSFRSVQVFLPPLYKSFAFETLNATFPFPQVFGLRRLRGNPPCSLWLQSVHWTNCFTRRAHITVPPKREPTVTAWRGTTRRD